MLILSNELVCGTLDSHAKHLLVGAKIRKEVALQRLREQLGYYLVEAKNANEAIAIAAKIPWARYGSIEVRPIMTFP